MTGIAIEASNKFQCGASIDSRPMFSTSNKMSAVLDLRSVATPPSPGYTRLLWYYLVGQWHLLEYDHNIA